MGRAVLSIVLVAACHGGGEQKPPAPQAMPVELATLEPTKVVDASEYMTTLRPLTAEFAAGVHLIVGPNGIGKTSLLNGIAGSLPLVSGSLP